MSEIIQQEDYLGVPAIIASPAMRQLVQMVRKAAQSSASILITGETGSGKEIIARAIHHYSLRSSKPWVDINCAALPDNLLESELFGHERGAFSGADLAKPGLFELAHTGTLFLDEVAELESRLQVKLLRVLDGVPYYRVGGQKKVTVDTRIVSATNRNLAAAVESGHFRRDLYHRLNQYRIEIPPLRTRREDILALAEHFLLQQNSALTLSSTVKQALAGHDWPGNVRELRNVVTTAAINCSGDEVQLSDLPPLVACAAPKKMIAQASGPVNLDGLERAAILAAMRTMGGHQQKTADLLGISRRTLSRKLKLYRPAAEEENSYA